LPLAIRFAGELSNLVVPYRHDAKARRSSVNLFDCRESPAPAQALVIANAGFDLSSPAMPAAGRRGRRSSGLHLLPVLDGGAIEAPITPHSEAGQAALAKKPINRGRMNPQMLRQFFYSEDFVFQGHLMSPPWQKRSELLLERVFCATTTSLCCAGDNVKQKRHFEKTSSCKRKHKVIITDE
jgi:hypothetical protein